MEPKIVAFGVLLTVLLLSVRALAVDATPHSPANGSEEMVPVMDESVRRMELRGMFNLSHGGSRRKLGSFQICAVCTCCGGITRVCISSPCCYSINCNMPNRPFGYCSFTPKTCNCFGCHL
uniref:DUF7866 domain-containing protein n=1 Tax=Kalanchoe fedtschenkoi TaxID=63787 RepID=A0A7N0TDN3_KALFE